MKICPICNTELNYDTEDDYYDGIDGPTPYELAIEKRQKWFNKLMEPVWQGLYFELEREADDNDKVSLETIKKFLILRGAKPEDLED